MRVFKATYKDRRGRNRESSKWYVEFKDHLEAVRRLPVCSDKGQTEQFGGNLEKLIAHRMNREPADVELRRWLDGLSPSMRDKLAALGLLDGQSASAGRSLAEHLIDFEASLKAKGRVEKHVRQVVFKARRIIEACELRAWGDVSPAKVERFLGRLRDEEGLSHQTVDFYAQAIQQFCRWMVSDRRWRENPLPDLDRLNVETDRRHDRRELSVDELRWLLDVTGRGPERFGMAGAERALLSRLACETGLRANELRSLTRASFDLPDLIVTLPAHASKRRKVDTLPLRPDTAELLRLHLASKLPTARAFNVPKSHKTARLLRADLEAARAAWIGDTLDPEETARREKSSFLAYQDADGRYADFHALRHSFLSNLAKAGIHPKIAQALARHSTISLTMDRYTHTAPEDQSAAVESLPDLSTPARQQARATGTDGRSVLAFCLAQRAAEESISMHVCASKPAIAGTAQECEKPLETRGFQADGPGFEPGLDLRPEQFSRLPP